MVGEYYILPKNIKTTNDSRTVTFTSTNSSIILITHNYPNGDIRVKPITEYTFRAESKNRISTNTITITITNNIVLEPSTVEKLIPISTEACSLLNLLYPQADLYIPFAQEAD